MAIKSDSLSPEELKRRLETWNASDTRQRTLAELNTTRGAIDQQSKGVEFIKNQKIGIKPEQGGDIREVIQKWLLKSERGVMHAQDPERGAKNLERIKRFFYSKYVPTLETFPREEYIRVQNEAALAH